jgi:CheY-like chemotaxis protein
VQDQIVLLRVQMPEMDGLTATSILRGRERGGDTHVAVIALTAHAMKGDQDRCLPVGMDAYLTNSTPRNSSRHPAPVPEPIPGIARFKPTESSVNAPASQRSSMLRIGFGSIAISKGCHFSCRSLFFAPPLPTSNPCFY